ncbi:MULTISPECIES: hypothetical protein [Rhodopseudomonas]|uniref:Uncharacterized protein n=1 Tax=Rhodopseudomonas palustris TaxID=1076 RepID=A0A0D7E5P6_RHOPL|nr:MULTISPECIES: hypothetical protein [Rhodopseudomonas]KIZ35881.1 hypothetical protein OO17_25260 [Rhodopseudomonas palustris]MDF3810575.1 hypothetical protein [Rhodopseudomonas sp. BAL398]WOK16154.1 hypothetical protein RBJ75_18530 [Rhodopseudomonas sp. BAL398]
MTKEDRDRAEARFNKAAKASQEAKADKNDRDASTRAVLDNMAKLKAARLAREAAEPPRTAAVKKVRAKPGATKPGGKPAKKVTPVLSEWLAGQQSGGRRT